jgi:hypothetical protein
LRQTSGILNLRCSLSFAHAIDDIEHIHTHRQRRAGKRQGRETNIPVDAGKMMRKEEAGTHTGKGMRRQVR